MECFAILVYAPNVDGAVCAIEYRVIRSDIVYENVSWKLIIKLNNAPSFPKQLFSLMIYKPGFYLSLHFLSGYLVRPFF
jgi:hypothetical protein